MRSSIQGGTTKLVNNHVTEFPSRPFAAKCSLTASVCVSVCVCVCVCVCVSVFYGHIVARAWSLATERDFQ